MIEITTKVTKEVIEDAVQKALLEALERGYSNPIKDAVDAELKEVGGAIKELVKEMITNAINDEKFKEQMQKTVIEKLVLKAMSN